MASLRVTSADVGPDDKPEGENISFSVCTIVALDVSEIQLVTFIASGAFGSVHKALFRGTAVAVKELIDRQVNDDEFWHEVKMMRGLRHPQLCLYMGACRGPDERLYLITEFLSGGDLSHLLAKKPLPPWHDRLAMVTDVARGLAYLHGVPVIHRDMKPNNILLDESGHAKVCDFGLSKLAPRRGSKEKGAVGNWAFGAPEMMRNLPYGRPVDVYSFGVILAQLLTGIDPEDEDLFVRNSKTFALDPACLLPAIPSDVPQVLVSVLLDSIRLNPFERPSCQLITNRLLNSVEAHHATSDVALLGGSHLRQLVNRQGQVYALTESGEVLQLVGSETRKISAAMPLTDVVYAHGETVVGIDRDRNLQLIEGGKTCSVIMTRVLSAAKSDSSVFIATESAPQLHEWKLGGLPTSLPFTGTVLKVACGANHVVAIVQPDKTPETVRVWGANNRGQLGLGDLETRVSPTPLTVAKENFVSVACGAHHTLLLTDTGRIYSFGANESGQLGIGNFTDSNAPSLISDLRSATTVAIDAYSSFSAAVTTPSAVYGWGSSPLFTEKRHLPVLIDRFAKKTVYNIACAEGTLYAVADAPIRASERLARLSSRGSLATPIADADGRSWWEETWGVSASKVPWQEFATKLEAMGHTAAEKAAVWQLKDLFTGPSGVVSPDSFHRCLCFFPPFASTLRSAAELLSEPWFRCEAMERAQTDSLLAKKPPGTRTPGNYVLAVAGEKGAMQVEILSNPKSDVAQTLRAKIQELVRESKVTLPLPKEENSAPNPYAQSTDSLVLSTHKFTT